jgi:hypothetical protein
MELQRQISRKLYEEHVAVLDLLDSPGQIELEATAVIPPERTP